MSDKIVEFRYRPEEYVSGRNGESIKILHCLVPLSKELGENMYLVNYKNKIQVMSENDITSN